MGKETKKKKEAVIEEVTEATDTTELEAESNVETAKEQIETASDAVKQEKKVDSKKSTKKPKQQTIKSKRRAGKKQRITPLSLALQYGYLLLFVPAVIAALAFGVYYYLTIFSSITAPSAELTQPASVQIQQLTNSVEEAYQEKVDSADRYDAAEINNPFVQ